jgi:hypothetical protein
LKDKTGKKNQLKKWPKLTRVNLSNPPSKSWDHDNTIENKLKKYIYEAQFSINSVLKDEIEKKISIKKTQKITQINHG